MKFPKFIQENEFLKLHDGLSEIDLLKQFSTNLKLIHKLTTSHYSNFDILIKDYLQVGLKIFGMEIGIVSSVSDQDYIICDAISPNDSLKKGDQFELQGTYCREVLSTGKVIGFPHVGSIEEMKGHPVYQNMKLESYISSPIYKDEKIFGTLNFSSTKIRKNGFSELERDLIEMMANSIGTFLLLRDKEEKIEYSLKRIRKLTGFVAHDLRTPLGNIIAITEMIPDLSEEEKVEMLKEIKSASHKSLEIVHTILEAAILGDGNLKIEKNKHNLKDLVEQALKEFSKKLEKSNLIINKSLDDAIVLLDKERMMQVLSNLLSNLTKYSKPSSEASVSLKRNGSGYKFEIQNEIDATKIKCRGDDVSETGTIGFGLEIIQELLKMHNSELNINATKEHYSCSFEIK